MPPPLGTASLATIQQCCDPPRPTPSTELASSRSSQHCAVDLLLQELLFHPWLADVEQPHPPV